MKKNLKLTQFSLLLALTLIFAFSPIGYIKTLGVEITIVMIPVTIGAIVIDEKSGAILGTVFGLTSFAQCFYSSPFGAALLAINPFYTFIICLVPRILMGYLGGIFYRLMRKYDKGNFWSILLTSIITPLLNTILFTSIMLLSFGRSEYITGLRAGKNIFAFVVAFVGLNGIIEIIVCSVISTAVCKALFAMMNKK